MQLINKDRMFWKASCFSTDTNAPSLTSFLLSLPVINQQKLQYGLTLIACGRLLPNVNGYSWKRLFDPLLPKKIKSKNLPLTPSTSPF